VEIYACICHNFCQFYPFQVRCVHLSTVLIKGSYLIQQPESMPMTVNTGSFSSNYRSLSKSGMYA